MGFCQCKNKVSVVELLENRPDICDVTFYEDLGSIPTSENNSKNCMIVIKRFFQTLIQEHSQRLQIDPAPPPPPSFDI